MRLFLRSRRELTTVIEESQVGEVRFPHHGEQRTPQRQGDETPERVLALTRQCEEAVEDCGGDADRVIAPDATTCRGEPSPYKKRQDRPSEKEPQRLDLKSIFNQQ